MMSTSNVVVIPSSSDEEEATGKKASRVLPKKEQHESIVTKEEAGSCSKESDDNQDFDAQVIFNMLFNNPEDYLMLKKPSGIQHSTAFTIDTRQIPLKSVKADDNGSYLSKGTPRKFFHWIKDEQPRVAHPDEKEGQFTINERDRSLFLPAVVNEDEVYEIKRTYRQNKYNPWLTQTICQVKRASEKAYHPFILVIYKAKVQDEEFQMPRHGNATNPNAPPYYRQDPTVIAKIDEKIAAKRSTEQIYVSLIDDEEDTLSETIRNPKVIENRKQKLKDKGAEKPKTSAENLLNYIKRDDAFTKSFTLTQSEFGAFNYHEYQLSDIVRFCANNKAVLSVDTTFEICDGLYLTDTSYENLALKDAKTNEHPHFPGPSFWHFRKNEQTYRRFAVELLFAEPDLAELKTIGHDLDKAVAKGKTIS
ncbi:uncharacterized protein [Clytia hemisphaerica]|uniref:uncharacterized protein n=1 Tax=Clytia hemisphaerica TaxID=252671 RepID=UPI0034D450C2